MAEDKTPANTYTIQESKEFSKEKLKAAETNYWKAEFEKATNSTQFWKVVRKVQRKKELVR